MPICLASLPILPGSAAGAAALKYILHNVTCHTFPKVCGTSSLPNSKSPMSNVHQCSPCLFTTRGVPFRQIHQDLKNPKRRSLTISHSSESFKQNLSVSHFIHFIDFETSRASGKPHLLREVWLCRGLCRASNKSTWP